MGRKAIGSKHESVWQPSYRNGSNLKKSIQSLLLIIIFASKIAFIKPINSTNIVESQTPLSASNLDATIKTSFSVIETNTSSTIALSSNDIVVINTDNLSKGLIEIDIKISTQKRLKLGVSKNSKTVYYDVNPIDKVTIPLQLGNGAYLIQIFENISNTSYNRIYSHSITLEVVNENQIFLNPSEIVNYTASTKLTNLIENLIPADASDAQILKIAYDYLVENFKYDYAKIPTLVAGYIPSVDETIKTKKGICYDYAVLLASILRSQGIPTKLIMGETTYTPTYHAWNEVFIDGEWIIIDTTMDAINHDMGFPYQMIKTESDYATDLFY